MVFQCQNDSFQKTFASTVVSCEPATYTPKDNPTADAAPIAGFNVILTDTILFPEGGGQRSDRGLIDGKRVLHVVRHFADAIHFVHTAEPFTVGQLVEQSVDWPVRLDHMQQHSGQHLITAIFEQEFGMDTSTWYMGADTSFVQLTTKALSDEQLLAAESRINGIIAVGCEVSVLTVDPTIDGGNVDEQVTRATRGLPKDHVGAVRIVTFAGIESNMCCGTHVRNLSQLQAVKLLHAEPSKGAILLHFIVGDRVLRYVRQAYERERRMNQLLACEPAAHLDMLQRTQEKLKGAQRSVKLLQKQLAALEGQRVDAAEGFYFLHRKDGQDTAYLAAVQSAVSRKDVLLFGTTGEEKPATGGWGGKIVLQGRAADVDALGPVVCELLEGKGAGKNGRFQAKVNSLKRLKECEDKVADYFARLKVGEE